ncbi:MAG: ABC transporter ATP-binding protein [Halobacteriales archaeon]
MTTVSVEDVVVRRNGETHLDGVCLHVGEGEFVGLVGSNGAGKTTLLECVNGVTSPDGGHVEVGGRDVGSTSSKELARKVATMPQNPSIGFDYSVEEVVEMARHPRRTGVFDVDGDDVDAALRATDTLCFRGRRVSTLSGGELRRVLLARCIAQDTPVLLLDEPTANLDVGAAVEVFEKVRGLVDGGRTVLAAVHDLGLAARFCDRIVALDDGEVVARGDPADVLGSQETEDVFDSRLYVGLDALPSVTAYGGSGVGGETVHVVGNGDRLAEAVVTEWTAGNEVTAGPVRSTDASYDVAVDLCREVVAVDRRDEFEEVGSRLDALVEEADEVVLAASVETGLLEDAFEAVGRDVDVVDGTPARLTNRELRNSKL